LLPIIPKVIYIDILKKKARKDIISQVRSGHEN